MKNNELLDTLNNYETQLNTKDKEAKLAVALESIARYKKDIVELNNTNAKNVEELESKIIIEKREFSNKIWNLFPGKKRIFVSWQRSTSPPAGGTPISPKW